MREINRFNTGHYHSSEQQPSTVNVAAAESTDVAVTSGCNSSSDGCGGSGVSASFSWHDGHGDNSSAVTAYTVNSAVTAFDVEASTDAGAVSNHDGAAHTTPSEKIHVQYGKSAQDTFAALFDADGNYLYSGVKIEVPKRQAETVVQLLQEKAQTGSLMDSAGTAINNPTQLTDLIQEGAVD